MGRSTSIIVGLVRDSLGNPVPNARASFVVGPVPLPDIAALVDTSGEPTDEEIVQRGLACFLCPKSVAFGAQHG